jgi:AmiR/NasT family two-component response regulator
MKNLDSVRAVIAEDDFLVSKEIRRAMEQLGHTVLAEVSNGIKAVDKTCQLQPDVVLMDIQMPEMDGIDASKKIQEQCPTPVVVLTAYESGELVEQASATGVGAYLTKPPKPAEIQRAITISMARHADLMASRKLYLELKQKNEDLERALAEIKTLQGLIPICASCKKIRDDEGYWQQIEEYIQERSDAQFSHGICPECMQAQYPEIAGEILKQMKK